MALTSQQRRRLKRQSTATSIGTVPTVSPGGVPGLRRLSPSAGSGGSTGTRPHNGGGGGGGHTDTVAGQGYYPSTGAAAQSNPAPAPSAYPRTSSGASYPAPAPTAAYPVPTTVPASHYVNPALRQLTANTSINQGRGPGSVLARIKSKTTLLDQLNHGFKPGQTITPRDAALLAESVGLPGKTYAQIAKGESSLQPGAVGHDPGGTVGLGLWQMTPGVQSASTRAAWDKIASQHPGGYTNPVANALMAKYIAQNGTGVGNYYGTGFVTDPNAHVRGGPQRAQKILGGSPSPSTRAKGGPYVYPFSSGITIGRTDQGIDPSGPGTIRAIGKAKYLGTGGAGWPTEGGSGTGPVYKLLKGPQKGKRIFTYEGITPRTDLQRGDILKKGEPIAKSTGSSFETGYAFGRKKGFQPVASTHYTEGQVTAEGTAFRKFVEGIKSGGAYPTTLGATYGGPTAFAPSGGGGIVSTPVTGGGGAAYSTATSGLTSRSRAGSIGSSLPPSLPFAAQLPMPKVDLTPGGSEADTLAAQQSGQTGALSNSPLSPQDILSILSGQGTNPLTPRKRLRTR